MSDNPQVEVEYTDKEKMTRTVTVTDVDISETVSDFISKFCTNHDLPSGDYYIVFNGTHAWESVTLEEAGINGCGEQLQLLSKNIPA